MTYCVWMHVYTVCQIYIPVTLKFFIFLLFSSVLLFLPELCYLVLFCSSGAKFPASR